MQQKLFPDFPETESSAPGHITTLPPQKKRKGKPWKPAAEKQLPIFKKEKTEPPIISQGQAHKIMDSVKETFDEWICLLVYFDSLSGEELVEECKAFLNRHPHDDKLFWRNGWSQLYNNKPTGRQGDISLQNIMNPVRDAIFAKRPDGQSTYRGHDA